MGQLSRMTKEDQSGAWKFITFNQPKQHTDKDVRRLVRSNAQRSFRFSQKQAKLQSGALEQALLQQDSRKADAMGLTKPFCSSCGAQGSPIQGGDGSPLCCPAFPLADLLEDTRVNGPDAYYEGYPVTLLGAACIDPFGALPIESNVKYNCELLNHFLGVLAIERLPSDNGTKSAINPFQIRWTQIALQDAGLFMATMNLAAAHLDALRGDNKMRGSPDFFQQKGDTFNKINAKLKDPNVAISNEVIGAIAMLTMAETISCNITEFDIHMSAIYQMVKMRGGITALGWGILQILVGWLDIIYSLNRASPPTFQVAPCCNSVLDRPPILPYEIMGPISDDLPLQLPAQMHEVFHNIRYLSLQVETPRPGQTHYDLMCFSKIRTKSVHKLLCLGFPPFSSPSPERLKSSSLPSGDWPASHIASDAGGAEDSMTLTAAFEMEALRLAALLYLQCGLHMFIPFSAVVPAAMIGLKAQFFTLLTHFEELPRGQINAVMKQRATLTWALVVGSQLAGTNAEEALFARLIAKTLEGHGVKDWQGMEQRLRRICWVEMLSTAESKKVWERVRRGGW